jgi:hypothetical protein
MSLKDSIVNTIVAYQQLTKGPQELKEGEKRRVEILGKQGLEVDTRRVTDFLQDVTREG